MLSLDDLLQAPLEVPWLWHGYLAPGQLTLLTSQPKAGKTTLLAVLLDRLRTGGTLAGLAVRPGRAVVLSEESREQWRLRAARLPFGPHLQWFCRPFRGKPAPAQWLALLDKLLELHSAAPFDLLAVDTLATFFPGRSENDASLMLEGLAPLQRLTAAGIAVLLLHHPRKQPSPDGQAPRGSTALTGFADILIEMRLHAHAERRRRLAAFSRFDQTPRQLVIELDSAGADYRSLGDFADLDFADSWERLRAVFADADRKLTREQILAAWPPAHPPLAPNTLWSWLDRALSQGLLRRDGGGKKNDPFRYWLPDLEARWATDPVAAMKRQADDDLRQVLRGLEAARQPGNKPASRI